MRRLLIETAAMLFCAVVLAPICRAEAPPARTEKKMNPELSPDRIRERIRQHRTAEATLTVAGPDGKPLAGAAVTVRQVRHKFLFGCNAFRINTGDPSDAQKAYQRRFADLLNYATLPFYWGAYERTDGRPDEARLRMMAAWCDDNRIRAKGHPLCWHQVFPKWAMEKPLDELEKLQLGRITREVKGFAGLIDTWDVVNEAVVMPDYKQEVTNVPALCREVGRVELLKRTFSAARAANPKATLLLNDFDTSPRYEALLRECLDASVSIDVIGIQSHMHQGYWGPEKTWDACERFARFGKPIHFTETTIISGPKKENQRWQGPPYDDWATTPEGEERQAREVAEFYTVIFSHPAVQGITWWDFTDHAWLGAPAGWLRKDMSPKPVYDALTKLIKGEWWTPQVKLTTDRAGRATFRGFLGDYALECAAGTGSFSLADAPRSEVRVAVVPK